VTLCRLPALKISKYKLPFLLCWGRVLQRLSSDCHACSPHAAAPRTHSGAQKADFQRQASECTRRRGECAFATEGCGSERAGYALQAR
jgi:hypothetical protein